MVEVLSGNFQWLLFLKGGRLVSSPAEPPSSRYGGGGDGGDDVFVFTTNPATTHALVTHPSNL